MQKFEPPTRPARVDKPATPLDFLKDDDLYSVRTADLIRHAKDVVEGANAGNRYIITRHGIPQAIMISIEHYIELIRLRDQLKG